MATTLPARSIDIHLQRYAFEQNPYATDRRGQSTSWLAQLHKLADSDEGAFRILQICANSLYLAGSHSLSAHCSIAWQALAFPRLIGVSSEARAAINAINDQVTPPSVQEQGMEAHSPTHEQSRRRIVTAISRSTDAVAMYCYSASLLAEHVFKAASAAAKFLNFGDVFSLASDTTEAQMAAEDWNRSRHAVHVIRSENGPEEVVNGLVYTQRLALLRIAKSVLCVVGGIFAAWTILFNAALLSATAAAVLGLVTAVLACSVMLYKQAMPHKPIEMFNYFIPS